MTSKDFFKTEDGAYLYYEDIGSGIPIVLVNGFMCTTKFYQRNVQRLSQNYRVITFDARGYGLSSKTLVGNNTLQHAKDLRALIDYLELEQVVLMGWSIGSGVVALYADLFEQYKLSAIGFIDTWLSPFAEGAWNQYKFSSYKVHDYILGRKLWFTEPNRYNEYFFQVVDSPELTEEDKKWIIEEISMTMPWTGIELHLDYCHTDTMSCLSKITVPTMVFSGNSLGIPSSISEEACRRLTGPHEHYHFNYGGHMFFYTHAEEFNTATESFIEKYVC